MIGWYHGDFASVFWVILALAGIAYGYFYTHNHHADEVWETPDGFVIIIGENTKKFVLQTLIGLNTNFATG